MGKKAKSHKLGIKLRRGQFPAPLHLRNAIAEAWALDLQAKVSGSVTSADRAAQVFEATLEAALLAANSES
jgi:hypothetical protein